MVGLIINGWDAIYSHKKIEKKTLKNLPNTIALWHTKENKFLFQYCGKNIFLLERSLFSSSFDIFQCPNCWIFFRKIVWICSLDDSSIAAVVYTVYVCARCAHLFLHLYFFSSQYFYVVFCCRSTRYLVCPFLLFSIVFTFIPRFFSRFISFCLFCAQNLYTNTQTPNEFT